MRPLRLVKYVAQRYSTIRIGTLQYFRELEGAKADPSDGMVSGLEHQGPNRAMRSDDYNQMMRGSNLQIHARDGIRVGATGRHRDDIERAFPNVFVFCCSIEIGEIPDADRLKHFQAGDYWHANSAQSFAASVRQFLVANGQAVDGSQLAGLGCCTSLGPVAYTERSPAPVNERISDIDLLVFQKERRFAIEREYRFVWAFSDRSTGNLVPVQVEPIDIPITDL